MLWRKKDPRNSSKNPESRNPLRKDRSPDAMPDDLDRDYSDFQDARDCSRSEEAIAEVLKEMEYARPSAKTASPGSYDRGRSEEAVYGRTIGGRYRRTRTPVMRLGCVSSPGRFMTCGIADEICVDLLSGEPWYITASLNGGIFDFTLYSGEPVSYELVRAVARAAGEEHYSDISADNWVSKLPESARKRRAKLLALEDTP